MFFSSISERLCFPTQQDLHVPRMSLSRLHPCHVRSFVTRCQDNVSRSGHSPLLQGADTPLPCLPTEFPSSQSHRSVQNNNPELESHWTGGKQQNSQLVLLMCWQTISLFKTACHLFVSRINSSNAHFCRTVFLRCRTHVLMWCHSSGYLASWYLYCSSSDCLFTCMLIR